MIFALGFEVAKHEIGKAIIKEFLRRGLDKTYSKEIEEWKKYKREKKFAVKLDKQMKDEIERFRKDIKKWEPEKLEEIIWEIIPHKQPQ